MTYTIVANDMTRQKSEPLYPWRNTLQMLCLLVSMAVADLLTDNPFLGAFVMLSLFVIHAALHPAVARTASATADEFAIPLSASRMYLFSTVAMELGVMMLFCRVLVGQMAVPMWQRYVVLLLWLVLMVLMMRLFSRFVTSRWVGLSLAEFVAGAVTWVLGDIFMLRSTGGIDGLVWSIVWALGIVLCYSSMVSFTRDFETVAGNPAPGVLMTRQATLASAGIMLLVMAVWIMGRPHITASNLPRVLQICMTQLPVVFMLLALFFAVKNPLDWRNREKLMHYIDSRTSNEQVRSSLQRMLRGRVGFWPRLVCWLALPLFRHRVVGREHLRRADYPSIFVCNHGFLYGPIVASLYLPTYFRPWIHDRMLRPDLAAREIELSFPWVKRLFGRRMAKWLYRTSARMVVNLLQSFHPIPVVRGTSHEVATTFDLSLQALREGDNLLLFPEKPKRLAVDPGAELRNLYSGFAHLGKLYYDATGRRLLFYPIFSDHRRRTFSIGAPVEYDPTLPPRDAKMAVAAELQRCMEAIANAEN